MPDKVATTYSLPSAYLPFLRKKKKDCGCGGHKKNDDHEEGCGCDECNKPPCGCDEKKDCGCCPPGLVSVFDENDKFIGCLTPNDAELFMQNTFKCEDGFGKMFRVSDGAFIGCFNATDYVTVYPIVNP